MHLRFLAAAATILFAPLAGAAEVKVLSAGGIRPPLEQLASQFQGSSGHKVVLRTVGGPAIKKEVEGGADFDVVIAPPEVIEELIKSGKVAKGSRVDVARAGVGVAVRSGAPKPDVGSAEALKRALLGAKSVAFARDGTAGTHFQGVLDRLGIAKEIEPRLKRTVAADPTNSAGQLVARGEADMAVAAMATLAANPGLSVVGPLPKEFQSYSQFAAGIGAGAKQRDAAAAWIRFISAPAAAAAYKATGMEPAPQR